MKKIFIPILILLSLAFFTSNCNNKSVSQTGNDSTSIVKLETDFTKALVKTDTSTFEKLLAPGFIYTENEKSYSRTEMLSSLTSGTDTVASAYNQDMVVHLFGTTAVVTGWMIVKGKNAGGQFEHKYRFTDTWNKNEDWQLIGAQDYLMP